MDHEKAIVSLEQLSNYC